MEGYSRKAFNETQTEEEKQDFVNKAHEEALVDNERLSELNKKLNEIYAEKTGIKGATGNFDVKGSVFNDALHGYASETLKQNINEHPNNYGELVNAAIDRFLIDSENIERALKVMSLFPNEKELFLTKAKEEFLKGRYGSSLAEKVLLNEGSSREDILESLSGGPEVSKVFANALESESGSSPTKEVRGYNDHHGEGLQIIKRIMNLFPQDREMFNKAAFDFFEKEIKSGRAIDEELLLEFPTFRNSSRYKDLLHNVGENIKALLSPKDGHTMGGYADPAWSDVHNRVHRLAFLLKSYPELDVKEISPYIQKAHKELMSEHSVFYIKYGLKKIMEEISKEHNIDLSA